MLIVSSFMGLDPAAAATVMATVVAVITLIGAMIFKNFQSEALSGQLAAKDEVIKTNAQTIEAFEGRISSLENRYTEVVEELQRSHTVIEDMKLQVTQWERKYQSLKDFVAPASLERLIEVLKDDDRTKNDPVFGELISDLTTIRKKMDAVQARLPQL